MSATLSSAAPVIDIAMDVDIDTIDDEDVLKHMWQATEDFAEKRRIRARMYKLREKRLKDFYTSDDVMTASPSAASLPSRSASSYQFSSSTTSSSTMETDEADNSRQSSVPDQKRRSNNDAEEEDAVSEKIRRKSSERTKRYQMVLSEIVDSSADQSANDLASSTLSSSYNITNTTTSSSSSKVVDDNDNERAMTPDSLSGRAEEQQQTAEQVGYSSYNTRSSTTTSSSSSSERRSSNISRHHLTQDDDRHHHQQQQQIVEPLSSRFLNGTGQTLSLIGGADTTSYQELKSTSSCRQLQEGDILTIVEITETWRRIREPNQTVPVTQRVTLTKTVRKRVSDGAVLEENEDEVIDDIDEDGGSGTTAVDAALRRSSIVATDEVNEERFTAKKTYETECVRVDDVVSEPDSLDDFPLPAGHNVEISELSDSKSLLSAHRLEETSSYSVQSPRTELPVPSAENSTSSSRIQVEEIVVSQVTEPEPVEKPSSLIKMKRTPSESPSRAAAAPAKKRADSAELRKTTTSSSSSSTTTSNSRTGLGGINRSSYGSSTSSTTTSTSGKSSVTDRKTLPVSKSPSNSSSIPRLTSTPKKKMSDTMNDESVAEFLQLEQEIQSEKSEAVNGSATSKRQSSRPITPVTTTGRKTAELTPSRTAGGNVTTTKTTVTTVTSPDKKVVKKETTSSTTLSSSGVNKSSTSSLTGSSARKEINAGSGTKPSSIARPMMTRTVETTRTITVRGEEDKPWRLNSRTATTTSSRTAGNSRTGKKDLHNNVMSVVEKYVDSEGCALHGSHPHIHDDHDHEDDRSSTSRSTTRSSATTKKQEAPARAPKSPSPVRQQEEEREEDVPQTDAKYDDDEDDVVIEDKKDEPARQEIQRPKLLSVTPTSRCDDASSPETSMNKSSSKLTSASPVLGSPSVVKKARSLFHSDSVEDASVKAESTSTTTTGATASISKIRSSFETPSSPTPTLKREGTKLWERESPSARKLERSPSKDAPDAAPASKSPVRTSSLFKSRSPSPSKEIVQEAPAPTPAPAPAPVQPVSQSSTTESAEGKIIEEIEDLTLLENMLNTATNYDDRSRIRAHIRIVKKKMGLSISSPMPSRRAVANPEPQVAKKQPEQPVQEAPKKTSQPEPVVQARETRKQPEPAPLEVKKQPLRSQPEPMETVDESAAVVEIESSSRKTSLTQTTTSTTTVRRTSRTYQSSTTSWSANPQSEEEPAQAVTGGAPSEDGESSGSSPKTSRAPWRRQASEANMIKTPTHLPEPEANPETLDITSSYGTGPMDENGRPLFGLGALRRRQQQPKPTNLSDDDGQQQSDIPPRPIIIERSQTLTELQKLHESQTTLPAKELEPIEKPRAKLRDTFTSSVDVDSDTEREPIISERSQALREIIRIHEQVTSADKPSATTEQPPPSPKPKAKLKDSFVAPSLDSPDDDQTSMEQTIERSESFQTIVKRHQELSTAQPAAGPTTSSPPLKRPGILKKPKDWSSPSPQEIPSPVKEEQQSSSRKTSSTETRTTSMMSTNSSSSTSTTTRKASIESSIEIQLNPVQSSSIVVTEIPAAGLDRRNSGLSSSAVNYSTIQYNSVQDVKMTGTSSSSSGDRRGSQMPRKLSVDVEPSPTMHTSSVTLATSSAHSSAPSTVKTANSASSSSGLVLSGESTGHSVRSTSTFQLSGNNRTSSSSVSGSAATPSNTAASVTGDDPAPWRRKSIPKESSVPRDDAPIEASTAPSSLNNATTSTTTASLSSRTAAKTSTETFSPSPLRSNRFTSPSSTNNNDSKSATTTSTFQRSSVYSSHRYPPSQPENKPPESQAPRVKTSSATGASVRALAQKFIQTGEEKSQPQVSKSASYPKAGLIFRSNSFRSQSSVDGGATSLVRSESLRISPARSRVSMDRQSQERTTEESSSRRESTVTTTSTLTERRTSYQSSRAATACDEPAATESSVATNSVTTSKSFLQDRTPVRGMQDIIGRMRAGDAGVVTEEDRSMSLLNKLIGAQILLQCTEQAVGGADLSNGAPEESVQTYSSNTEERSADGTRLSRTSTQQRTGSSFESGQGDDGASWTRRSSSTAKFQTTRSIQQQQPLGSHNANSISAAITDDHSGSNGMAQTSIPGSGGGCVIDGVDINTCTDDFKLNELLDNCNDYETRRKIRARIKSLLSDVKADGAAEDDDGAAARQQRLSSSSASSSSSSSRSPPPLPPPLSHSPSSSSTSASSSSSTTTSSAASKGASAPASALTNSDVIDWVRRQAVSTDGIAGQHAAAALVRALSPPPPPPPPPAPAQQQESGELFDSGTESGEDSTTQSNHSQSDLNSFMANLAKLSLDSQHQSTQRQQQTTAAAADRLSSVANCGSSSHLPTMDLSSIDPIPAARDFLRQVDTVLDRLRSSLQPDELAEFNAAGSFTDHQAALHQHIASGGLDRQWHIHPQQQTELINLIDRLQSSLHHLETETASNTSSASAPAPTSVPAPPAPSTALAKSGSDGPSKSAAQSAGQIKPQIQMATHAAAQSAVKPKVETNKPGSAVTKPIEKKTNNNATCAPTTTSAAANAAPTIVTPPAATKLGITSVKLRAKTFTNPPDAPLQRPSSFLRTSWRSSSEPTTPTTSPSPTPTPTPPPPKVHWRAPDFLSSSSVSTPPASHRPIWCRDAPSAATASSAANAAAPSKIVLEKSGIRGRFVTPELNPAPVVAPKAAPPSVRLPSFTLNKVSSPSSPPVSQLLPTTSQQQPALSKQTVSAVAQRPLVKQPVAQQPVAAVAKPAALSQQRPTTIEIKATELPSRAAEPEQPQRPATNESEIGETTASTSRTTASMKSSKSASGNSSSGGGSNVPWKVKLAKKRAERSQTTVGMDGQVSVDLRKSIQLAAHRKSLEDVRVEANPEPPFRPEAVKEALMRPDPYPLLKQKSLGELYTPKPKPFLRSESVGTAPLSADSLVKKFNWGSRGSSIDKESKSSDRSSAPQTPLSPDPPSPVISAAIAPSKSGHNWVLSLTPASSSRTSSSSKDDKRQQMESKDKLRPSSVSEVKPKTTAQVKQPAKAEPQVHQEVEEEEVKCAEEAKQRLQNGCSKLTIEATKVEETTAHRQQATAADVEEDEEEEEDEEGSIVITGVLKFAAKEPASSSAVATQPQISESEDPVRVCQRQTSSDLTADPSAGLFTPAESLQIAIHKAAIKASLNRQISEREAPLPSPDASAKVANPMEDVKMSTPAQLRPAEPSVKSPMVLSKSASTAFKITPSSPSAAAAKAAVVPPPTAAQPVRITAATQPADPKVPSVSTAKESESKAAQPSTSTNKAVDEPSSACSVVTHPPKTEDSTAAQQVYTDPVMQKQAAAMKAAMTPLPPWKERARRCNTVAFSAPSSTPYGSTANKFQWRPVQPPAVTVKTENDRKFQNLFQKNAEELRVGVGFQSRPTLPADPAGGGVWTNKFSNIRSSFESRPSQPSTPTQSRSRRSSADDMSANSSNSVTSGHLQLQLNPGQLSVAKPEEHASTTTASAAPFGFHRLPKEQVAPALHQPLAKTTSAPDKSVTSFKPSSTVAAVAPPEDNKPINMRMVVQSDKAPPVTNMSIRSSSADVRPTTFAKSFTPFTKQHQQPEEEARIQHVRMTVQPSQNTPPKADGGYQQSSAATLSHGSIPTANSVSGSVAAIVQNPSIRRLRNDRSCSSIQTQSSFRSDSKEEDDEDEEDKDMEGDDEASSSTSSEDDEPEDGLPVTVRATKPAPSAASSSSIPATVPCDSSTSSSNVTGLKKLTKILQQHSGPNVADIRHSPSGQFPVTIVPPTEEEPRALAAGGAVPSYYSSSGILKSYSSHHIRSTSLTPGEAPSMDRGAQYGNSNSFAMSRTKSMLGFGVTSSSSSSLPTTSSFNPPVRPPSLALTGSKSFSTNDDPTTLLSASHYVEPTGPTLVGLVARNVATSSARSPPTTLRNSGNSNSIANSALTYSAHNLTASPASLSDYSPTCSIMRSVSSSRIVSEARQQLERRDSIQQPQPPLQRPRSLVIPSTSPEAPSVRRNPSLGTKQYEASLSPDSAEKKQREILQFFGAAGATAPPASSSAAPVVIPSAAPPATKPKAASLSLSSTARSSGSIRSSSTPKTVHSRAMRQFSVDELGASGSDVDEVFNKLLSEAVTPELRFLDSPPLSGPHGSTGLDPSAIGGGNSSGSSSAAAPNRFADRRRAWEASTRSSVTLHSSLLTSEDVGHLLATTTTSRPADAIQRANNSFGSTVTSRTEVSSTRQSNFMRSGQPGQSAFSKFQQLDQSVKSSTSNKNATDNSKQHQTQTLLVVPTMRPRLSTAAIKERLLQFCKRATAHYQNVQIENFSSSWNDGLAFCALIHHFYPDAFDFSQLEAKNKKHNFTLAFKTAEEKAGIAPLLDVDDMVAMPKPDWKCVFTYVQSFYRRFKDE